MRATIRIQLLMVRALVVLLLWNGACACAQFGEGEAEGQRWGQIQTEHWRVGMRVTAQGGPCRGLFATVPVPTDWPEQSVRLVDEDLSPQVKRVSYRIVDGGVRQMLISIPELRAGEKAHALLTFEVDRRQILAPSDPDNLGIPKRVDRQTRRYLSASPFIESRHKEIRNLAQELYDENLPDWEQIEKLYDWVRSNVTYENGPLKGALAALRDKNGDCEELTSLFIALCRAQNVPARTVWVPGHCYPEFYLEDSEGNGLWYPCQAAGTRSFGEMLETRPVLQKGDNFRVPEKKERQRYVAEFLTGKAVPGGGRPSVEFVREATTVQ